MKNSFPTKLITDNIRYNTFTIEIVKTNAFYECFSNIEIDIADVKFAENC